MEEHTQYSSQAKTSHYCVEQSQKASYGMEVRRNIHKQKMRKSIKSPWCPVCQKVFFSQQTLHRHLNCHLAQKTKYHCNLCERTYSCITSYYRHRRIHEGNFCHVCNICSQRFFSWTSLHQHISKMHQRIST